MQKAQVAYIGLNSLFARAVTSLLKQSPGIKKLILYDDKFPDNRQPEKDKDDKVTTLYGREKLPLALSKADIIVIGDDFVDKTVVAKSDHLITVGAAVADYGKVIAAYCPNAILVVTASPLNCIIPMFARVLDAAGCFDPKRLLGATSGDTQRASSLLASYLRLDPQKVILPVIGGASPPSRIPLLSQAQPPHNVDKETQTKLVTKVKLFDVDKSYEVETVERAYTAVRFVHSIVLALNGNSDVPEIALTKNLNVPEAEYFSLPIMLGKNGVKKIMQVPKLSHYEKELLTLAIENLNLDVKRAENVLETLRSGKVEIVRASEEPQKLLAPPDKLKFTLSDSLNDFNHSTEDHLINKIIDSVNRRSENINESKQSKKRQRCFGSEVKRTKSETKTEGKSIEHVKNSSMKHSDNYFLKEIKQKADRALRSFCEHGMNWENKNKENSVPIDKENVEIMVKDEPKKEQHPLQLKENVKKEILSLLHSQQNVALNFENIKAIDKVLSDIIGSQSKKEDVKSVNAPPKEFSGDEKILKNAKLERAKMTFEKVLNSQKMEGRVKHMQQDIKSRRNARSVSKAIRNLGKIKANKLEQAKIQSVKPKDDAKTGLMIKSEGDIAPVDTKPEIKDETEKENVNPMGTKSDSKVILVAEKEKNLKTVELGPEINDLAMIQQEMTAATEEPVVAPEVVEKIQETAIGKIQDSVKVSKEILNSSRVEDDLPSIKTVENEVPKKESKFVHKKKDSDDKFGDSNYSMYTKKKPIKGIRTPLARDTEQSLLPSASKAMDAFLKNECVCHFKNKQKVFEEKNKDVKSAKKAINIYKATKPKPVHFGFAKKAKTKFPRKSRSLRLSDIEDETEKESLKIERNIFADDELSINERKFYSLGPAGDKFKGQKSGSETPLLDPHLKLIKTALGRLRNEKEKNDLAKEQRNDLCPVIVEETQVKIEKPTKNEQLEYIKKKKQLFAQAGKMLDKKREELDEVYGEKVRKAIGKQVLPKNYLDRIDTLESNKQNVVKNMRDKINSYKRKANMETNKYKAALELVGKLEPKNPDIQNTVSKPQIFVFDSNETKGSNDAMKMAKLQLEKIERSKDAKQPNKKGTWVDENLTVKKDEGEKSKEEKIKQIQNNLSQQNRSNVPSKAVDESDKISSEKFSKEERKNDELDKKTEAVFMLKSDSIVGKSAKKTDEVKERSVNLEQEIDEILPKITVNDKVQETQPLVTKSSEAVSKEGPNQNVNYSAEIDSGSRRIAENTKDAHYSEFIDSLIKEKEEYFTQKAAHAQRIKKLKKLREPKANPLVGKSRPKLQVKKKKKLDLLGFSGKKSKFKAKTRRVDKHKLIKEQSELIMNKTGKSSLPESEIVGTLIRDKEAKDALSLLKNKKKFSKEPIYISDVKKRNSANKNKITDKLGNEILEKPKGVYTNKYSQKKVFGSKKKKKVKKTKDLLSDKHLEYTRVKKRDRGMKGEETTKPKENIKMKPVPPVPPAPVHHNKKKEIENFAAKSEVKEEKVKVRSPDSIIQKITMKDLGIKGEKKLENLESNSVKAKGEQKEDKKPHYVVGAETKQMPPVATGFNSPFPTWESSAGDIIPYSAMPLEQEENIIPKRTEKKSFTAKLPKLENQDLKQEKANSKKIELKISQPQPKPETLRVNQVQAQQKQTVEDEFIAHMKKIQPPPPRKIVNEIHKSIVDNGTRLSVSKEPKKKAASSDGTEKKQNSLFKGIRDLFYGSESSKQMESPKLISTEEAAKLLAEHRLKSEKKSGGHANEENVPPPISKYSSLTNVSTVSQYIEKNKQKPGKMENQSVKGSIPKRVSEERADWEKKSKEVMQHYAKRKAIKHIEKMEKAGQKLLTRAAVTQTIAKSEDPSVYKTVSVPSMQKMVQSNSNVGRINSAQNLNKNEVAQENGKPSSSSSKLKQLSTQIKKSKNERSKQMKKGVFRVPLAKKSGISKSYGQLESIINQKPVKPKGYGRTPDEVKTVPKQEDRATNQDSMLPVRAHVSEVKAVKNNKPIPLKKVNSLHSFMPPSKMKEELQQLKTSAQRSPAQSFSKILNVFKQIIYKEIEPKSESRSKSVQGESRKNNQIKPPMPKFFPGLNKPKDVMPEIISSDRKNKDESRFRKTKF